MIMFRTLFIIKEKIINSNIQAVEILDIIKESTYSFQPKISKILNTDICKNSCLIIPLTATKTAPDIKTYTNTFTFVSTILNLFTVNYEVMPSAFSIQQYLPIWLSFCNMKA